MAPQLTLIQSPEQLLRISSSHTQTLYKLSLSLSVILYRNTTLPLQGHFQGWVLLFQPVCAAEFSKVGRLLQLGMQRPTLSCWLVPRNSPIQLCPYELAATQDQQLTLKLFLPLRGTHLCTKLYRRAYWPVFFQLYELAS